MAVPQPILYTHALQDDEYNGNDITILFLRSFGNTGPGCPDRARGVYCIRSLRQHLVHAFSSRPNSSTDFPELVDSICRAICSEYGIAGTQTLGLFSFSSLFAGFSNGVQNFTCARASVCVCSVYTYVRCMYTCSTRTPKKTTRERKKESERGEKWWLKIHKQPRDVQRIHYIVIYVYIVYRTIVFFFLESI